MAKEFPIDVMDDIVRKIIKILGESDFGYILLYNQYLEFLHRVMLDSKRDREEEVAPKIRTLLRRKKMGLDQTSTPIGEEYELFKKIDKDSTSPYLDFKKIVYTELRRRAQVEETCYTVIYPLNFELKQKVASKLNEIHGSKRREVEFEIISHSEFAATAAAQDIPSHLLNSFSVQFSFCIFKDIYARNDDFVVDYCTGKLACILGLLSLSFGGRVTYGDKPKPALQISRSYALLFKNGSYSNYYSFADNKPPASFETIDQTDIDKSLGFLRFFNEIKSKSIIDLLSDALVTYFEASVEADMASAYLKYWVCMENCLLTSDQEKMIRRLKGLPFWGQNQYWIHQMFLMPQIRNDYVHELKTEASQFDRNFVHNIVVGNLIRYLLQTGSKFSDKNQLELFLDLVSRQDLKHLQAHKKMAELARKEIQDFKSLKISS